MAPDEPAPDPTETLQEALFGADPSTGDRDPHPASVLTDRERLEFLAVLDWKQAVSWNQVYTRYKKQRRWCLEVARLREDEGNLKGAARAQQYAKGWSELMEAWERQLILTASVEGRRSKQLVEALTQGPPGDAPGEGARTRVALAVEPPDDPDDEDTSRRFLSRR